MSVLSLDMRVKIASALAEGVALRGAERLTGVTRKTISSFLLTLGDGCALLHDRMMRGLVCDALELDEVWGYVGCKEGHRDDFDPDEYGDAYTWVALDVASRAIVTHLTDKRTAAASHAFATDLRSRVAGKPQITTDGFKSYLEAIEAAFGSRVHYAQVSKVYAADEANGASRDDVRYSRGRVIRSVKRPLIGAPDEDQISTSYVERNNLTTRMWVRRLTRLTTCFSRRLSFLRAAMRFHFCVYNLARVTAALRVTPAMQLGVTDHVWSMEELVTAALDAVDDAPPGAPVAPMAPSTALVPGARARALRRSAGRRVLLPVVIEGGGTPIARRDPLPRTTTVRSAPMRRRDPEPLVTPESAAVSTAPEPIAAPIAPAMPSPQLLLPAVNDDRVPRVLTRPTDAATDMTWMW